MTEPSKTTWRCLFRNVILFLSSLFAFHLFLPFSQSRDERTLVRKNIRHIFFISKDFVSVFSWGVQTSLTAYIWSVTQRLLWLQSQLLNLADKSYDNFSDEIIWTGLKALCCILLLNYAVTKLAYQLYSRVSIKIAEPSSVTWPCSAPPTPWPASAPFSTTSSRSGILVKPKKLHQMFLKLEFVNRFFVSFSRY